MDEDDTPLYAPLAFLTDAQRGPEDYNLTAHLPRASDRDGLYAQGYLGAGDASQLKPLPYVHTSRLQLAKLEALRREPRALQCTPKQQAVSLDYASSGTLIDAAVAALDEALPGAQKARAEVAYALLSRGVQELGVWMRANGYDI